MKKITLLFVAYMLFSSHDMYLKMGTYYLQPKTSSTIQLFNGTFENSDNIISRDRMIDVSLVGQGSRTIIDTSQWTEKDDITILNFTSGEEGTWVAGVSTRPRDIELEAKEFNEYLEHDGVLDMLEWRKQNDALNKNAIEKYSKHVKTIFQVGTKKTRDWQTVLGYPIEFIPLNNPYDAKSGDHLQVQLLWQGQPLSNQLVYAGSPSNNHNHSHTSEHEEHHHDAKPLRTNDRGIVTVNLTNEGQWYLRTIHMEHSEEDGLTHESNWATLTFQVGREKGHAYKGHQHGDGKWHSHEEGYGHGLPTYIFVLTAIVLVVGLLWIFRPKA